MRRPRSQVHTGVLALCVFGCLWVATTDERIGDDRPRASVSPEFHAAGVDHAVEPVPAAFEGPAPFAEEAPGPRALDRILGNAAGPVRPVLTH